jgi:hypothetical protein
MSEDMHPGRVEPAEERLAGLALAIHEIHRGGEEFLTHGFHAFFGQWAGVLDLAISIGVEHSARAEPLLKRGVFRIVGIFRLFLGIEMIEISEEFIEAVFRRQKFVLISEMVFAELPTYLAEWLEHFCDRRILWA